MAAADRWFREDTAQPFVDVNSQRAAVADLNGDGHEDLILNDGSPHVYFGDGAGAFAEAAFDPFPDAPYAQMLVFGDLDNDGDRDAFAVTNVSPDGDGDGVRRDAGDCDNADAAIRPGTAEIPGNGKDDDCDTVADDGTDTSDADGDGFSIAAGDCNDTLPAVYPGAPEIPDNRDNDCDGEADEDFYHRILENDGTGHFTEVPDAGVAFIEPTAAAAFGDGNGDGNLDVYWGNWLIHYPDAGSVHDHYATGNGDGTFVDASDTSGVRTEGARACYGVIWNDYNNDGLQDIGVHNYGYDLNFLWENQGSGVFVDVGLDVGIARDAIGSRGGNTFGGDWGDIDNDGDLDLFEANIAHPRYQPSSDPSLMLVNGGAPDFHFTEQREALGIEYDEGDVNAAFGDYDNDGDLDLVVTPVYPGHFSRLYRNDGGTHFTDVTYETGTAVMETASPVWSDVDEDGDLDLIIADRSGAPFVHLFINEVGQDNHWLQLDLQGTASNRDGIGARVALTAGGTTQLREVKGGGGHGNTQQTRIVQFGLGSGTAIDSLTVRWVGGATETITGLAADHRFRVVEGSGTGVEVF
jgi:hypothetical protein